MRNGRHMHLHYVNIIKILLLVSILFLLTNALTFPLMPIANNTERSMAQWELMAVGLIFWISLLLGYTLLIIANMYRREFVRKRLDGDLSMGCHMGLITFFSTVPGSIADSIFIVAILALLIVYLLGRINNYITYFLISILTFSLNMHGVFNGRIYKATKYKRIVRRGEDNE